VLVIGAAIIWAGALIKLDVYAITPGLSQPVGPLITVHDHPHAPTRKTILLTDVFLTQLNVWQWVAAEVHPVHEELIPGRELTGGNVPTSELERQGYLQMYDSQNNAKVVGMRAMGLTVTGVPDGVTVQAVATNAPARGALQVGDRIVEARGRAVHDFCDLEAALSGAVPGTSVPLRIVPAEVRNGVLVYGSPEPVSAGTGIPTASGTATGCAGTPTRTVALGIVPEDSTDWHFPVKVTIDTAYIGGPSAGLAMTLGVMDALSKVSVTGGVKVATTGTIAENGVVGPVGGVAEKTIAVENAGATVFLVPAGQGGVAKGAASPGLKVIAVRTLSQALAAIERLGGTAPVPITETSSGGATS
jgi:PDZ domain-containing protein